MQVGGEDTGTAYSRAYLVQNFSLHLNFAPLSSAKLQIARDFGWLQPETTVECYQ
jgi:hypothetical protein